MKKTRINTNMVLAKKEIKERIALRDKRNMLEKLRIAVEKAMQTFKEAEEKDEK